MVRSFSRRAIPKPFAALLAVLMAVFFIPTASLSGASADSVEGGFEIDGNLLVDDEGNIDWESVLDGPTANDNAGGDPTVFQTSSRENGIVDDFGTGTPAQWQLGSPGTAPPKADIGNVYKYIRTNEDTGHIELFFAWDRMSASGTDYFYLELNKLPNVDQNGMSVPNRSVGDVRFTLHEQGGDTIELLAISEWDGTKWVAQDVSGTFVGEVNDQGPVDLPEGWNSPAEKKDSDNFIPEEQFLETYFDLTELIDLEPDCPPAFGTLNFRTTTGETGVDTGNNLKDFISPIALDAPSTCGALSIFKEDEEGDPLGGAIFEIDPNPLPDGVDGSDLETLVIYDDSDGNTDVEVTPDVAVDTNYDDPSDAAGEITLDEILPGDYTVTELAAPLGYILDGVEKTLEVPAEGTEEERFDSVTFTNSLGSVVWEKRDADSGELICCASFNVIGTGGAAETLGVDIDVTDNEAPDNDPANGVIELVGLPTGDYEVTETAAPDGYQLPDNDTRTFSITAEDPDAEISSDFLDELVPGSLTIEKTLTGPVAGASTDFIVALDCEGTDYDDPSIELNESNDWVDGPRSIPAGTVCEVTELAPPSGWTLNTITPAGKFTVGTDTLVEVTVNNARLFGVISVTKNIVGAPNGASTSFTFDVDCPGTEYDQSLTINVGGGTSGSATTGQIPTGLACTVTERATPDWNLTSVVPAGGVVTVPGTATFTNTRKQGVLNVSKAVSPVAGNGVVVEFGDTLTYTLTVSATGEATQHNVEVSDFIPGYDPARPTSGKTTYVNGSAACVGAGTCTVSYSAGDHKLTWGLGDMPAGTTRQVTFKVTIDDVAGDPGETVAVDILNAGAVKSTETPTKPSNQVITPVTKVFPVKAVKPPKVLPHTGAGLPLGLLATTAVGMLGFGLLLLAAGHRRRKGSHRA